MKSVILLAALLLALSFNPPLNVDNNDAVRDSKSVGIVNADHDVNGHRPAKVKRLTAPKKKATRSGNVKVAKPAKTARVNSFYHVNRTHDVNYTYGFEEKAGNFDVKK